MFRLTPPGSQCQMVILAPLQRELMGPGWQWVSDARFCEPHVGHWRLCEAQPRFHLARVATCRRIRSLIRALSFWKSASTLPASCRSRGTWIASGSTGRDLTRTS